MANRVYTGPMPKLSDTEMDTLFKFYTKKAKASKTTLKPSKKFKTRKTAVSFILVDAYERIGENTPLSRKEIINQVKHLDDLHTGVTVRAMQYRTLP